MTTWRLAAVLLIITGGLFSIGVAAEPRGEQAGATPAAEGSESGHEASEHEARERGDRGGHADQERVLGVDVESPLTVTAAVTLSVVLAVGLWLTRRRWPAALAAGFAVLFAALDGSELLHQINERRAGLIVLAALLVVGHITAGVLAGRPRRPISVPAR